MSEVVAYRLSAKKPVGRSSGKSVIDSAAYISRSKLFDDELGKSFSHQSKNLDVLFSAIITPEITPHFLKVRETLWNNVQKFETHIKAQFARALELNLPHELKLDEMINLLTKFVQENFINLGMIADVNIHKPDKDGDKRNFHVHMLLTLRHVNENGFIGNKAREWNSRELFKKWRENLAFECSIALELAGYKHEAERWKYAHLTLKEQLKKALERGDNEYAEICNHAPTKHKGVHIHQMERKGIVSFVEEDRKKLRAREEKIREEQLAELSEIEFEHEALLKEEFELEDEILRQKLSHIFPSLENRSEPIKEEFRIQLKRILQKIKSKEQKREEELEYKRERDDEYER
jgi:ATP-dependent exoDNAse (exonuclease V) alpha subunit